MSNCYGGYDPNYCQCGHNSGAIYECNGYKEKSDELYDKAQAIQEEVKRLICKSKELDEEAKELERRAKEACAAANMAWNNARKLDAEAQNLLDLACFYACKATECYKNVNKACNIPPSCNGGHCGCHK